MTEKQEMEVCIQELRQIGNVITTYTDNCDRLYILNFNDKRYNLDTEAQLRAQIELLDAQLHAILRGDIR